MNHSLSMGMLKSLSQNEHHFGGVLLTQRTTILPFRQRHSRNELHDQHGADVVSNHSVYGHNVRAGKS